MIRAHIGYRQAVELLLRFAATDDICATVVCGDFNVPAADPIVRLFRDSGYCDAHAAAPQAT